MVLELVDQDAGDVTLRYFAHKQKIAPTYPGVHKVVAFAAKGDKYDFTRVSEYAKADVDTSKDQGAPSKSASRKHNVHTGSR